MAEKSIFFPHFFIALLNAIFILRENCSLLHTNVSASMKKNAIKVKETYGEALSLFGGNIVKKKKKHLFMFHTRATF